MAKIGIDDIGSTHQIEDPDDPGYYVDLQWELCTHLSRYLVPVDLWGNCSVYFYCWKQDSSAGGYPILFSDQNGSPGQRVSSNEQYLDMNVSTPGWRMSSFFVDQIIPESSYVWFGFMGQYMVYPTFEEGGKQVRIMYQNIGDPLPNSFNSHETMNLDISQYFLFHDPVSYSKGVIETIGPIETMTRRFIPNRNNTEEVQSSDLMKRQYESHRNIEELPLLEDWSHRTLQMDRCLSEGIIPLENPGIERGRHIYLWDELEHWDYPQGIALKTGEVLELRSRITTVLELSSPL